MSEETTETISFDVKLRPAEAAAFFEYLHGKARRVYRRSFWTSRFALFTVSNAAFLVGFIIVWANYRSTAALLGGFVMYLSFVGLQFAIKESAKRGVVEQASIFNGRYTVDATGVAVERPGTHSFVTAGALSDVEVTAENIFVQTDGFRGFVFPRRCIGDAERQQLVIALLTAQGVAAA